MDRAGQRRLPPLPAAARVVQTGSNRERLRVCCSSTLARTSDPLSPAPEHTVHVSLLTP